MLKKIAIAYGVVFVVVGILGFVPAVGAAEGRCWKMVGEPALKSGLSFSAAWKACCAPG